jgi:hypothetical protein
MKSKEEIEQLAEKTYGVQTLNINDSKIKGIIISATKGGYVDGYFQCQEDIIKELIMHILINEHDWNRNPQAQLKDFINSLSKTKQ